MGGIYDSPTDCVQHKGVNISLRSEPLSEADKMNGFEWKGSMIVTFHLSRTHWRSKGWSDWSQDGTFRSFALDKKKGEYHCDFVEALQNQYEKIPCSKVPQ